MSRFCGDMVLSCRGTVIYCSDTYSKIMPWLPWLQTVHKQLKMSGALIPAGARKQDLEVQSGGSEPWSSLLYRKYNMVQIQEIHKYP